LKTKLVSSSIVIF